MSKETNEKVATEDTEQVQDQEQPEGQDEAAATKGSDEDKSKQTKQSGDYAKTQQQLDQERANRKRAQAALQEMEGKLSEREEQLTTMQTQIEGLQKQVKDSLTKKEYENLESLDPNTTDVPDAVKALQKLTAKVQEQQGLITKLQEHIDSQQKTDRERQLTQARSAIEEEIYATCDEEFGAQFRNEAIKMADDLVDDGEAAQPKTQMQGYTLMRRCYAEVAKKHAKPAPKTKETVPTDSGLRGLNHTEIGDSEEFKPGSLDQVKADIAKRMKTGKWKKAFAGPS